MKQVKEENEYANRKRRSRFNFEKWLKNNKDLLISLDYELNIHGGECEGSERNRALIAATIAHLPEEVREKTLEEAIFIMVNEGLQGRFFVLYVNRPKTLRCILLNFDAMKRLGDSRKMDTIAHEIAHFWLCHGPDDLDCEREKQIDR